MAVKNTEGKTTVSHNLKKAALLYEYTKGKGKEATFKDMVMKDNNIEEKEVHKGSALDALKDDEKWLTHFLLTEFDGLSNVQKELEEIQGKKKEKRDAVGKEHAYLYPSPAAVGTSEFDSQIEDVLDTIRKHVKTEDITEMVANGKLTISENLSKPVSQNNNTEDKGKEATLKDLDLQNNNSKEKEDDMKWLTHFLLTELDELFIALQETKMRPKGIKTVSMLKKSAINRGISKTNQVTKMVIVRTRDLYWYPLPVAIGSPEYNIRIQEVLDTIKKHVKTDDIVEPPDDKEDDLPVINFNISEYFCSISQDNNLEDSETQSILF